MTIHHMTAKDSDVTSKSQQSTKKCKRTPDTVEGPVIIPLSSLEPIKSSSLLQRLKKKKVYYIFISIKTM
jgi:hypothetical protein